MVDGAAIFSFLPFLLSRTFFSLFRQLTFCSPFAVSFLSIDLTFSIINHYNLRTLFGSLPFSIFLFFFFAHQLVFFRTFFASIKAFGIYSKNSGHFFWCWWWWQSCQWTLYSVQCLCTFQQTPKTQPLPHRHTLTCVFTQTDSSKTVRQLSRVLEMRPLHTSLVLLLKQKNFGFLT